MSLVKNQKNLKVGNIKRKRNDKLTSSHSLSQNNKKFKSQTPIKKNLQISTFPSNSTIFEKIQPMYVKLLSMVENKEDFNEQANLIYQKIKGSILSLSSSNKSSRMLQLLLKCDPPLYSDLFYLELKDDIINLSQSRFSNHLIIKLFSSSPPPQFILLFKTVLTNLFSISTHRDGYFLVDYLYQDFSSNKKKSKTHKSTNIFKMDTVILGKAFQEYIQNSSITTLSSLTENNLSQTILQSIQENLSIYIDRIHKKSLFSSIYYHHLFSFYLSISNVSPFIEIILSHCVKFLSSFNGYIITFGTNNNRKHLLKNLKEQIPSMITHPSQSLIVARIMSVYDDTVIIQKYITPHIISALDSLNTNQSYIKLLLWIISFDFKYFTISEKVLLSPPLSPTNPSLSIKDNDIRQQECLTPLLQPLSSFIQLHLPLFLTQNLSSNLLKEFCRYNQEFYDTLISSLSTLSYSLLSHPTCISFLRQIISFIPSTFLSSLYSIYTHYLSPLLSSHNIFLLISFYEHGNDDLRKKMKIDLSPLLPQSTDTSLCGMKILSKLLYQTN